MFWLVEHDENPTGGERPEPEIGDHGRTAGLPENVITLRPQAQRCSEGPRVTWIGPIEEAEAQRLLLRVGRTARVYQLPEARPPEPADPPFMGEQTPD